MRDRLIAILVAACVFLTLTISVLAFLLFRQPRFVATKSLNPYIMFDNKTAQACWSGPRKKSEFDDLGFRVLEGSPSSPELPLCKDLK